MASVSTLKKKARQNALPTTADDAPMSESAPHARYASANSALVSEVHPDREPEESGPGDREEIVVEAERRQERQPVTARIERAVAVEEPLLVDAADDAAEAKIFRFFGCLRLENG